MSYDNIIVLFNLCAKTLNYGHFETNVVFGVFIVQVSLIWKHVILDNTQISSNS